MNKYRAKRTTVDGITFHSAREARRYSELKLFEKAGEIAGLRCQVPYDIVVNDQKICRYVADFVYLGDDGGRPVKLIVEDCKGFRTADYKLKAKLMKAVLGIEIRET